MTFGLISFAMLIAANAAQLGTTAEFPAIKTKASQSGDIQCSNGVKLSITAQWATGKGASIKRILFNDRTVATAEVAKVTDKLTSATDIRYVETWCSGSHDAGIRIHFIAQYAGKLAPLIAEFQVRDYRLFGIEVKPDPI